MVDSDTTRANLMIELMRRVDKIEAGTCTPECLKELGLLSLRLSAMNAGIPFHTLLYAVVDETLCLETVPTKVTVAAIMTGAGN